MDRGFVTVQIARRIVGGQRRLAQHVIRIAKALGLGPACVLQRFGNRLAGDELLAHHAHGHVHALADQRLAALGGQALECAAQPRLAVRGDELARQQQAPGSGVDEQRRALAQMRLPVAAPHLVADQRIARGFVGDAQQRLGQAHQRHAFLRRQRELLQQPLHDARAPGGAFALAQGVGQTMRQVVRGLRLIGRQPRLLQQRRQRLRLRPARGGGDGVAQGALGCQFGVQGGEGIGCGHGGRRCVDFVGAALAAMQRGLQAPPPSRPTPLPHRKDSIFQSINPNV